MASRKRKAPYRFTDKRAATTALACSLLQRSMGHSLLPNPNDWEAVSDSIIFQLLDENIEALDAVDPVRSHDAQMRASFFLCLTVPFSAPPLLFL